jgi:hypothetical protein
MVFENFEKKHGPPKNCRAISEPELAAYQGKLPNDLLELWKQSGWCSYGDGLLWTINPADYSEILGAWPDVTEGAHAFVRTAFGSIVFWDGELARFLDVLSGDVSTLFPTMDFNFNGALSDDKYLNAVVRQKLFKEALPRLGPPAVDECYAFVPALPLGGTESSASLQKVKLREHLHILAQLFQ